MIYKKKKKNNKKSAHREYKIAQFYFKMEDGFKGNSTGR